MDGQQGNKGRSDGSVFYDMVHSRNTPAWVSAVCAFVVAAFAAWAIASAPPEAKMEDFESRIRTLEQVTSHELARLNTQHEATNTQLSGLNRRLDRLSNQIDALRQ